MSKIDTPETGTETIPDEAIGTPFNDAELRAIKTFSDAKRAATEVYGDVQDAADVIGNGFTILRTDQKHELIGKPFVILTVTMNESDDVFDAEGNPAMFVSALIVTERGDRLILNDGSSGIYKQLEEWKTMSNGRGGGLLVKGGLRQSDYMVEVDGKQTAATTYYLNP